MFAVIALVIVPIVAILVGLALAKMNDNLNPRGELVHISNTTWDD